MSEGAQSKKRKFAGGNRKKIYQKKKCKYLEPGFRGFMVTCNFREKECIREGYTILNEYADNWTDDDAAGLVNDGTATEETENTDDGAPAHNSETESEAEDISSQLDKEIEASAQTKRSERRFQQVDTGTPNCLFIKAAIRNPVGLATKIVRDLVETKIQKTRFMLRLLPVESVCRANVEDIKNAAGKLFDKYFLKSAPTTYSIAVNKRYNNNIDRMGIIHELADIIAFKNAAHKVDLGHPKVTVVVEVIKGLCCLSVVPDYLELKKYNLAELSIKADTPNGAGKIAETNKADAGTQVAKKSSSTGPEQLSVSTETKVEDPQK